MSPWQGSERTVDGSVDGLVANPRRPCDLTHRHTPKVQAANLIALVPWDELATPSASSRPGSSCAGLMVLTLADRALADRTVCRLATRVAHRLVL